VSTSQFLLLKKAPEIFYLNGPAERLFSKCNMLGFGNLPPKQAICFLWVKPDIPLQSIFYANVNEPLEAETTTCKESNVISKMAPIKNAPM